MDMKVQTGVQYHFLTALAGMVFATLVHAIVLTYFMGTGRWIEETSSAYRLSPDLYQSSQSTKYRVIPLMVVCILLLIATGAFGAAADPGSAVRFKGWFGITPAKIHLTIAIATLLANVGVNYLEFHALEKSGQIIEMVLAEVRRIRIEKGLAV